MTKYNFLNEKDSEGWTLFVGEAKEIRDLFFKRIAAGDFFRYVEYPRFTPGRTYGLTIEKSESIDSDYEVRICSGQVARELAGICTN